MEAKPKNLSGFEAPDLVRSYLDLVQDADDVQELGTVSESATRDDRLKQNERDQVLNAIGARREQVVGPAAMATVSGFDNASDLLVQPEVGIEQAKKLWDTYKAFREYILKDDACADVMPGGGREMNRTGATRLAMPFGLSVQQIRSEETAGLALPSTIPEDDRKYFPPEGDVRYKKLVDVSKGRRHVQGEGSCRLSEIEVRTRKGEVVSLSRREHDASTRAWTRAAKRGIADILGGTEAD